MKINYVNKEILKAGIIENNIYMKSTEGTTQGSILSPVLANIYALRIISFGLKRKSKLILREKAIL